MNTKKDILIYTLFIVFFLAALIFIWSIILYYGFKEKEDIIAKEKDSLYRMCQIINEQTSNLINEIKLTLKSFDIWLQDNPDKDPRTNHEFIKLVNNVREETNNSIDIRLVSDDGGLFYIPSKNLTPLASVSDREFYKAQFSEKTRGFFIAQSVLSRVTNKWGIPISYPLKNNKYNLSIIFAALLLEDLNNLYEITRPKSNGTISLIRSDGILLTRAPFDDKLIGKSLIGDKALDTILTKKSGTEILITTKTDNVKKIMAFIVSERFPIIIAVASDYEYILRNWNTSMFIRLIILIFITILFFIISTKLLLLFIDFSKSLGLQEKLNIKLEENMNLLKKNLTEKELIIREVNHRMKNHMSQLISLINMTKYSDDKNALELLKSRIFSYNVLYDKLCYKADSDNNVNIYEYIKDLSNKVIAVYKQEKEILCDTEADELYIDAKKTTLIGLIISELITNSIKYAFENIEISQINIKIFLIDNKITIIYKDNGSGFNFDEIKESSQSEHLGFMLIDTMIKQYNGKIKYINEQGSNFKIVIDA